MTARLRAGFPVIARRRLTFISKCSYFVPKDCATQPMWRVAEEEVVVVKITGLDGLTKQLDEARKAFAALDGEIGTVRFDPHDPASIETAIQQIELAIDDRAGAYANNPIVAPMIEQLKERYRDSIIQKAAAARLGDVQDD